VARIDGSVQSWDRRGVGNVRLQRKSKYATADIFVSLSDWMEGSEQFRVYLASAIEAAIAEIIRRAEHAGDHIHSEALLQDVRRATSPSAR
jgi:hypothetical protein